MSTQLLQELQKEVRRLYIAGSDLATDDFRLKKLLPQFQQLGQRAPIFGKLGEAIEALISPSDDSTSHTMAAVNLQQLGSLLHAVLTTQGTVQPKGNLQPEGDVSTSSGTTLTTFLTYRQLAPIQNALTTSGGGRFEIIVEAFKQDYFQDLRLFPLALSALSDPYADIADYVANNVLPAYGVQVTPYLTQAFNMNGGKSDVRRLKVLHIIGDSEVNALIRETAEHGSDELRVLAMSYLTEPQHEQALIAWSKDKKKAIRAAAYQALAQGGFSEGQEVLYQAFKGKDQELVADALEQHPSSTLTVRFIPELMQELTNAVDNPHIPKVMESVVKRIEALLHAIDGELNEELEQVYTYAIPHLSYFKSIGLHTLPGYICEYFEKLGTMKALEQLTLMQQFRVLYLPMAFQLATRLLAPSEVYDRYGDGFEQVDTSSQNVYFETLTYCIKNMIYVQSQQQVEPKIAAYINEDIYSVREPIPYHEIEAMFDPRWLDWFIKYDEIQLICIFARQDHAEAKQFLLDRLAGAHNKDAVNNRKEVPGELILSTLERLGVSLPDRQQLLLDSIGQVYKYSSSLVSPYLINMMLGLSPSAVPILEAALPYYHYRSHDVLEFIIKELSQ